MTMKSSTFPIKENKNTIGIRKPELLDRHSSAIREVLREAKSFTDDRRRNLNDIKDRNLRESAKK